MTNSPSGPVSTVRTGIPGLDVVLGDGLPEYSFNLVAGGPGAGKTTLVQQILFANATPDRPALYFTVLGEPTLKMIRYQQRFSFFDETRVPSAVRFVNLSSEASAGDLEAVLERIVTEVAAARPAFIAVDSFRTIGGQYVGTQGADVLAMEHFIQRLAQHLTTWEVTSFLIGEYSEAEQRHPVFTVADGILWLSEDVDRNSAVRKLRASKVRGGAPVPGLHTFRITRDGITVFPRIAEQHRQQSKRVAGPVRRLRTGIPGLDEMMGGGIPAGDVVMITGPAGSGKTTFAAQFIAQGLAENECCVVAVFEEFPDAYLMRAKTPLVDLAAMVELGQLAVTYFRPLDLSVDEMLAEILHAVRRVGASRVVLDSLSGFEVALAPTFRVDFKESLYRLVGALTAVGVTLVMTAEVIDTMPHGRFTNERVSFVTDDIIVQRYVEIEGRLSKVIAVVKMRGSAHATDFRTYRITDRGAAVGPSLADYRGITTGVPHFVPAPTHRAAGLTEDEAMLLDAIRRVDYAVLEDLVKQTGVPADTVRERLGRLVALGLVATAAGPPGTGYRATARPPAE